MEEDASNLLSRLKISTDELRVDTIQELFIKTKKGQNGTQNEIFWIEVSESLWTHINKGLTKFDDQLLCSTCFYSVLTLLPTEKQEYYCNAVLELLENELTLREDNKLSLDTSKNISFMYGMFQSSFLTKKGAIVKNLPSVLQASFKLLTKIAYEYSKFTFMAFKTIGSFKKVCGTELQEYLFSKENQVILLNLTNHNWENPITGVRDLNRMIFQTLTSVLNHNMYEQVLEEINCFYWSKAKYLMLTEIVGQSTKDVVNLLQKYNWTDGLIYSLQKTGLVSAGADLYYAIFKKLNSAEIWCSIFLEPVINILNGPSIKAIENFNNYWCLTTFKTYPTLVEIIMNELQNIRKCENKLYSSLYVLKQANKLGFIIKDWDSIGYKEKVVLEGLDNYNNFVRMLAFEIVCVSQEKAMPLSMEYELIMKFLKNNVNSDCTVLRISMLNSFSNFLNRLFITFLNYMKNDTNNDMKNLEIFCKSFQQFIIDCLFMNGNYQRKITCIKLVNTFLNGLTEVPRKRQKQTRQSNVTIIGMLKQKGQWMMNQETFVKKLLNLLNDPAEDIRENVTHLLLKHFSKQLTKTEMLNDLIEQALKSMASKFFYEISCGQSMFKLIINLVIEENNIDAKLKSVDDIFNFANNELINEYKLKRGVVEAIETGKQLHSFMSILHAVLEVSLHHSNKMPDVRISELIDILNGISNQFSWDEESSTSSDFSKMSDMVQNIISTSGCTNSDEDETKISGLHQIILNCLWLNVKSSCDLSSLIIRYQKEDSEIEICKRCLHIITHVLETCRHKGAIEAAGSALGQAIQYLTSLPEDSELSMLPLILLKEKLKDLIKEASKMASVTRRGAGLSVMVHRIVSSDSKKDKPLFHYFMKILLATCNSTEDISNVLQNHNESDNKDLPKAIYIHFLTRVVTDSSLASDMMFYSAELAELAFDNLTSSHWQIRNAALQLYGALIPKLIGQKKASGMEEETIATVASDEFRTHSPKLWIYIQSQLKKKDYTDKLQFHSDLIPLLNLLANSAMRYNFSYDNMETRNVDTDLLNNLFFLLDSPIYTVRRLIARSIFNMFSFEDIYNCLEQQEKYSENLIHGSLTLITYCHKYYGNKSFKEQFERLNTKFTALFNYGKHSYISKKFFEDVFYERRLDAIMMEETMSELKINYFAPGVYHWAHSRINKIIQHVSWYELTDILEMSLKQCDSEEHLKVLLNKIEEQDDIPVEILSQIANILISHQKKFNCSVIWQILYQIALQIDLSGQEYFDILSKFLEEVTYQLRYVMPFAVRIYSINMKSVNEKQLWHLATIISSFSNSDVDTDIRLIAAIANYEMCKSFDKLPEQVKVAVIKSAVIYLQDEDEDVRMISIRILNQVSTETHVFHPYICLTKMLDISFLKTLLTDTGIELLFQELTEFLTEFLNSKTIDKYNPFANDSRNIYLEVDVFKQMIVNLKRV